MADCEMSSMAPGFQYLVPHGDAVREITEPLMLFVTDHWGGP